MTATPARPSLTDKWPAWLAGLLAVLGLAWYVWQSAAFARTSIPDLDEGAYLYKGLLFATQGHHPFETFGVQTNKAPLAFLIPGMVQAVFGPGLLTGRGLAILFGTLSLVAVWGAARRLSGLWPAALAVWTLALSPAVIKIYSSGVTQSSIAFFMAVILALSLGEGRPLWQLVLAGFLAGAVIMVRQNMVIVLPLLVLYLWWQHGWRSALWAGLAGAAVLLVFHILYWPYIMQLWTPWMPGGIASLFAKYSLPIDGEVMWNPQIDVIGRMLSFFQGVRFHFVAMVGLGLGLLLWPKRRAWVADEHFRAAVFLAALFAGLLLMHSWASISNDYCVFCFTPYVAFFSNVAILFVAVVWGALERDAHPGRQVLLVLLVLVVSTGIGFSAFEDIGDGLLTLPVPRVRDGWFQPGFTTLWDVISNKFILERNTAEKIVSTAAGALVGLAFLLVMLLVKRWKFPRVNFGYLLAVSILVLGLILSPLLAGSAGRPDCADMDVIAANEQVGRHLAEVIPLGSQVYWNGGLSVAPLLYAPQVSIYLPQINDGYAYRVGGDSQELLKYGLWNDILAAQWKREADYVIVEAWRYPKMKADLPESTFVELPRFRVQTSCIEGSDLRIFQRK
jgi:4-amino-4-deoxy-L-arabinose transferase-like glycosyltransferase